MELRATRVSLWRSSAGIAACLTLGWFVFVRETRVPILGLVDLGFHELGHMLSEPLPDALAAAMGSLVQVGVPVGLALYFFLSRRDLVATGLCLAWAATSATDVSVYIADAPFQRLPLIGGVHDWGYVLGPEHLDALSAAHTIAAAVKMLGMMLLIAGIGLCVAELVPSFRLLHRPLRAGHMWRG